MARSRTRNHVDGVISVLAAAVVAVAACIAALTVPDGVWYDCHSDMSDRLAWLPRPIGPFIIATAFLLCRLERGFITYRLVALVLACGAWIVFFFLVLMSIPGYTCD